MKTAAGFDLGSTWAKRVLLLGGEVKERSAVPSYRFSELLGGMADYPTGACGYFRDRVPDASTCTEITAALVGTRSYYPDIEVIIDIGGQDVKVTDTRTNDLRMNDKCAAGTGAFLEFACSYLGIGFGELGELHELSSNPAEINETCGVFALTAMVSALADGYSVADVVAGLHNSFARRVAGIVPDAGSVAVIGGVAADTGLIQALSEELDLTPVVPPEPQFTNATGAAIIALKKIDNV